MEILENREGWFAAFQAGWLAHFAKTGEMDWKIYNRPTNAWPPAGPGVDLRRSRLMLITTAGGYLRASQQPFEAPNPLGDYSLRTFPAATPLDALAFAHDHYDHTEVNQDPQVLVPLRHLEDLVAEGRLGALSPTVISYSGYQPVVTRIVDDLIPLIREVVQAERPQAALLVPSCPLCSQSVGLVARALEMDGIATTLTTWSAAVTRLTRPPRAAFTHLARGMTLGRPGDTAQQRRILEATLSLLEKDAPLEPVLLEESLDA